MSLKHCGTNWTGYDKLHSVILVAVDNWISAPRREVSLVHVLNIGLWPRQCMCRAAQRRLHMEQGLLLGVPPLCTQGSLQPSISFIYPSGLCEWSSVWCRIIYLNRSSKAIESQEQILHCPGPEQAVCEVLFLESGFVSAALPLHVLRDVQLLQYFVCVLEEGCSAWEWESPVTEPRLILNTSGLFSCCCHWFLAWPWASSSAHWSEQVILHTGPSNPMGMLQASSRNSSKITMWG